MNVLIVGPHPDDETYSCFGTMAKLREAGSRVICYSASCGGPNDLTGGRHRIEEAEKALGLIGMSGLMYHHMRHGLSQSDYSTICYELDLLISDHGIDTIFSPCPEDSNQDHRMISDIVLSAVRRKKISVIYYNALSSLDFLPNLWVDITLKFDLKLQALSCFESQKEKDWMDFKYVEMFNQDMPSKLLGYKYAERFIIKRCFL